MLRSKIQSINLKWLFHIFYLFQVLTPKTAPIDISETIAEFRIRSNTSKIEAHHDLMLSQWNTGKKPKRTTEKKPKRFDPSPIIVVKEKGGPKKKPAYQQTANDEARIQQLEEELKKKNEELLKKDGELFEKDEELKKSKGEIHAMGSDIAKLKRALEQANVPIPKLSQDKKAVGKKKKIYQ